MAQKQIRRVYHQGELPLVLSPKEAENLLDVSSAVITKLCVQGDIEAEKFGKCWRINTASLLERLGIAYTGEVTTTEIFNTLLKMRPSERQEIVRFCEKLDINRVYQLDNRGAQYTTKGA